MRPALGADGKPKDQAGSKVGMGDELRALLQGYPNDLDLAFAACLADVDNDTTADAFALFLESWRNGDESFYRALDRTAGTKGEVFYYDAMLGEFMAKFASGDKKDSIPKKGLQSAHDALHNGFLTYRQYRGLREAFALSLVLPADVKLPKNLTRYETAPTGQFSLRDDVQMLLALSNGAVDEPTRSLVMGAKPMPSPLWSENYEPLQPFFDAFAKTARRDQRRLRIAAGGDRQVSGAARRGVEKDRRDRAHGADRRGLPGLEAALNCYSATASRCRGAEARRRGGALPQRPHTYPWAAARVSD